MIEVGEYIRSKEGQIYKADEIFLKHANVDIKSHSKNIKDLVEENDYVNGNKVVSINGELYVTDDGMLSDIEIKSIVTKEQFNSVMYKVGVENE